MESADPITPVATIHDINQPTKILSKYCFFSGGIGSLASKSAVSWVNEQPQIRRYQQHAVTSINRRNGSSRLYQEHDTLIQNLIGNTLWNRNQYILWRQSSRVKALLYVKQKRESKPSFIGLKDPTASALTSYDNAHQYTQRPQRINRSTTRKSADALTSIRTSRRTDIRIRRLHKHCLY